MRGAARLACRGGSRSAPEPTLTSAPTWVHRGAGLLVRHLRVFLQPRGGRLLHKRAGGGWASPHGPLPGRGGAGRAGGGAPASAPASACGAAQQARRGAAGNRTRGAHRAAATAPPPPRAAGAPRLHPALGQAGEPLLPAARQRARPALRQRRGHEGGLAGCGARPPAAGCPRCDGCGDVCAASRRCRRRPASPPLPGLKLPHAPPPPLGAQTTTVDFGGAAVITGPTRARTTCATGPTSTARPPGERRPEALRRWHDRQRPTRSAHCSAAEPPRSPACNRPRTAGPLARRSRAPLTRP